VAGGNNVHESAGELQRRHSQEEGGPPVAPTPLSVSSRLTTDGEQNEADAQLKTTGGKAYVRHGVEVPVLPWPDQTPHHGARGSGVVIWGVHRDASCGLLH